MARSSGFLFPQAESKIRIRIKSELADVRMNNRILKSRELARDLLHGNRQNRRFPVSAGVRAKADHGYHPAERESPDDKGECARKNFAAQLSAYDPAGARDRRVQCAAAGQAHPAKRLGGTGK